MLGFRKIQKMFRFRCLGSGSSGNAYLIQTEEGNFLIDAGVGIRKLKKHLQETGVSIAALRAILLTHDHSDHSRNVGTLQQHARKGGATLMLYATERSIEGINNNPTITHKPIPEMTTPLHKGEAVGVCGCSVTPFEVPHDSMDNVGYFIQHGGQQLCLVTDAGSITEDMISYISKTENLILEANFDTLMLENGPYPEFLKRRIRNGHGHLSNENAARTIFQNREHLKRVWLCHLSENNNTPSRAIECVEQYFEQQGFCCSDFFKLEALPRIAPSTVYDL